MTLQEQAMQMVLERDVRMYGIDYRNGIQDALACGEEAKRVHLGALTSVYTIAVESMDDDELRWLMVGLKRCPLRTPEQALEVSA